jgi:antitoxin Phd
MEWQLADAKNKFSEVFSKAMEEGPQRITRRNKAAILIDEEKYERLTGKRMSFKDYLLSAPKVELDLTRDKSPMRDVEF